MTINKYKYILLVVLVLSDFLSGATAFWLTLFDQSKFFLDSILLVLTLHCGWFIIFFFANLYNTRATLSRFDEIIRLVPITYSVLVLFIVVHIFGLINFKIDYKEILTYGLVFSAILIVNRFIIHTIQKFLLNKKIGLNNALILGINRRGTAIFKNLQNQPFHGLNVTGFIQANDDPIDFKINDLEIEKIGNEADINKIIETKKIDDVIIALDKPNPERIMSSIVSINGAPSSIKILPDMYEVVTGLARTTQLVGLPLIDVNLNIDTFYSRKLKRFIESIVASAAVVFCLPFG